MLGKEHCQDPHLHECIAYVSIAPTAAHMVELFHVNKLMFLVLQNSLVHMCSYSSSVAHAVMISDM